MRVIYEHLWIFFAIYGLVVFLVRAVYTGLSCLELWKEVTEKSNEKKKKKKETEKSNRSSNVIFYQVAEYAWSPWS